MTDNVFTLSELEIEWEGNAPIFDEISFENNVDREDLEARIYLSKRKTDLLDMVERFSTALGFASIMGNTNNLYAKFVLGFAIASLINPYKIKILSGNGIDDLLDQAEIDEETDEQKIEIKKFLVHCKKAEISSSIIDWFSDNGFAYTTDSHIIFRNSFERGKIISRA